MGSTRIRNRIFLKVTRGSCCPMLHCCVSAAELQGWGARSECDQPRTMPHRDSAVCSLSLTFGHRVDLCLYGQGSYSHALDFDLLINTWTARLHHQTNPLFSSYRPYTSTDNRFCSVTPMQSIRFYSILVHIK